MAMYYYNTGTHNRILIEFYNFVTGINQSQERGPKFYIKLRYLNTFRISYEYMRIAVRIVEIVGFLLDYFTVSS